MTWRGFFPLRGKVFPTERQSLLFFAHVAVVNQGEYLAWGTSLTLNCELTTSALKLLCFKDNFSALKFSFKLQKTEIQEETEMEQRGF